MSEPPHHVSAFSTDMLPERERFGVFLEEIARKLFRLEVTRQGDAPFYAHFRSVRLGAVNVVEARYSPARYGRSREMLADGNDDFVFQICTAAPVAVDQTNRTLRQGDGALVDNARTGNASCAAEGAGLLISLPRKAVLNLVPGAEDVARLPTVSGDRPEMILLRNYLATLLDSPAIGEATLQVAGAHVLDLVSLALGASGDAAKHASTRGLRAARALAVRQSVSAQLNRPGLSSADVAKANAISERYLRQLFEDMGTSFSDFLIERRLELARRLLANPLYRSRRISEIAFEAGFSDLSHFNRRFRARFGETPSAARAAATTE
ncbi:MAG: helix-turn-helix domain-containing protein [Roseiarcus sp.]|jgi:AraC-like DNA-binding protein